MYILFGITPNQREFGNPTPNLHLPRPYTPLSSPRGPISSESIKILLRCESYLAPRRHNVSSGHCCRRAEAEQAAFFQACSQGRAWTERVGEARSARSPVDAGQHPIHPEPSYCVNNPSHMWLCCRWVRPARGWSRRGSAAEHRAVILGELWTQPELEPNHYSFPRHATPRLEELG